MKQRLETLYKKYNRREYLTSDPIHFLYDYKDLKDREIVGLIASTLAYGNVKQIIKSVKKVLDKMTPTPHRYLISTSKQNIKKDFLGFKHRFTDERDIAALLCGIRKILKKHGSLEKCFLKHYRSTKDLIETLSLFVTEILGNYPGYGARLLPKPKRGGATKRLHMYLRWMVRCDDIDPGGWNFDTSKLLVPLDVHMHRISQKLGFTSLKQANLKASLEVTKAFRRFSPQDPVKYDFCLTRIGILKLNELTSC